MAPNVLLLDEPTNDLDIQTLSILEDYLDSYDGVLVVVSHDRYFISQIANKIVELRDGELKLYRGDYHYYLDKIAEEKEKARLAEVQAKKAAKAAAKREKQRNKKREKANKG
jgi:ATP-binding cassette subfamily F protein 3